MARISPTELMERFAGKAARANVSPLNAKGQPKSYTMTAFNSRLPRTLPKGLTRLRLFDKANRYIVTTTVEKR